MLEAKRTLVKSVPELWAEVSDPECLARHLASFGSVRITRTQPDQLVEWEAELGTGSVGLRSSGFGTRVTLVARPVAAPEPTLWARFLRRRPAAPASIRHETVMVVLTDMLDALGRAHHRPFSRA
jgi:hypothetical protein